MVRREEERTCRREISHQMLHSGAGRAEQRPSTCTAIHGWTAVGVVLPLESCLILPIFGPRMGSFDAWRAFHAQHEKIRCQMNLTRCNLMSYSLKA